MIGSDRSPAPWPYAVTLGDRVLRETVEVVHVVGEGVGAVETPVTVTAAKAQVRKRRDRDATLILDLAATFSGSTVSWGDVVVPNLPGRWWWDLQVTGTAGGVAVDLTILGDRFVIYQDVSHGS